MNFRKSYPDSPSVTTELHFSLDDIKAGRTVQETIFPRLGRVRSTADILCVLTNVAR